MVPVRIWLRYEDQHLRGEENYEGHWAARGGAYYCIYEEHLGEQQRLEAVRNTLRLGEKTLTLIRQGAVQCRQQFRQGEAGEAPYRTPYVSYLLRWQTHRLHILLEPERCSAEVELAYSLWIGEEEIGQRELKMRISP